MLNISCNLSRIRWKSGIYHICIQIDFFIEQQTYRKQGQFFVLITLKICASMEGTVSSHCFSVTCQNWN